MTRASQALLLLPIFLIACPPEAPTTTASVAEPPSTASAAESASPPVQDERRPLELADGWVEVPLEPAPPALETARAAKQALGQRLMGRLGAAIEGGDFARGVEVCQQAATGIAQAVGAARGVAVGRTSFRTRNPANAPEPFMEPVVDARLEREILMRGPEGQLAYMAPIRLGELCVNCHGAAEQIPEPVRERLAKLYPDDEATGFSPGELRGWFHVQIPRPAASE